MELSPLMQNKKKRRSPIRSAIKTSLYCDKPINPTTIKIKKKKKSSYLEATNFKTLLSTFSLNNPFV